MAEKPKKKSGTAGQNPKQTGPAAASAAGRVLRDPKATPDEKAAAGSDLAQAPTKPKKPKGKKK